MRRFYLDGVDQVFARIDSSGNAAWYLPDRMGSIRDITDATGTVQDHINYDGFGNVTYESNPNSAYSDRYRWTGREFDSETGLQFNRDRYYDPKSGRWISQDPIGFSAADPNLYRYVRNTPANYRDPNGQFWTVVIGGVVGAGIGGVSGGISAWLGGGSIAGGIVGGAVSGGVTGILIGAGVPPPIAGAAGGALGGMAGNITGSIANGQPINVGAVVQDGIIGGVTGGIFGWIGGRVGPRTGIARGREYKLGPNCRIAPWGNRTNNQYGKWPHYHRRVPDPANPGQGYPGQGIGRHRPWERKSTDRNFWERF
jgi:RHS repeat-associated protein